MLLHVVAHAAWHTRECMWWHDIGHGHNNHSLAVECCCMRLHMQPGTLVSACGGMTSVMAAPLTVGCCRRLRMQPGTLVSACGGMTSVMATPITAWLWHAVACGCTCNLAHS